LHDISVARSLQTGTKPYGGGLGLNESPDRRLKMKKISARNVLEGIVKDVEKGATAAHVHVDVNGATITSSITNESIDDLGLKPGVKVKVVIKSSDVMLAVE
jgi:molybdopterin-binding protein